MVAHPFRKQVGIVCWVHDPVHIHARGGRKVEHRVFGLDLHKRDTNSIVGQRFERRRDSGAAAPVVTWRT